MLPGPMLERAFSSCGALDAQHSEVPPGAGPRLNLVCPGLKALLQDQQQQGQAAEQRQPPGQVESGSSTPDAED